MVATVEEGIRLKVEWRIDKFKDPIDDIAKLLSLKITFS